MKLLTMALDWLGGFTTKFWLGLCLALTASLPVAYCKGRGDGRDLEQGRQEKAIKKAVAEALKKEREAAAADVETKMKGEGVIADRRKELDDAKANLPDHGLTARQHARACAELRRSGSACPLAPATR